jgi:hypothetical protein
LSGQIHSFPPAIMPYMGGQERDARAPDRGGGAVQRIARSDARHHFARRLSYPCNCMKKTGG